MVLNEKIHPPFPKQREIVDAVLDPAIHLILNVGSVGSGKSLAAAISTIQHSLDHPGRDYLLIALSVGNAEVNLVPYFESVCNAWGIPYRDMSGNNRKPHIQFGNSRGWLFGAGDKKSSARIRGATASGVVMDEAVILEEDVFIAVHSRLRQAKDGNFFVLCTTNAGDPNSWVKQYMDDDLFDSVIVSEWKDNPYLGDEWRAFMEETLPPTEYRRQILNEWITSEPLVYPTWYDGQADNSDMFYVSIDAGTAGTTAALKWIQKDPREWVIVDEYYHVREHHGLRPASEHAAAMDAKWGKPRLAVVDPNAVDLKAELRKIWPMVKNGRNAVDKGIRETQLSIMTREITFGNVPNTKRELAGYHFKQGADVPEKEFDHAMDALRYGRSRFLSLARVGSQSETED